MPATDVKTPETEEKPPLEVVVETNGPCEKTLKVTVPAGRVQAALDRKYADLRKSAQVPGFRPGHAPRRVLERRFGEETHKEVREELIEESLKEAVEGQKIETLGPARLEDVEFQPPDRLAFKAGLDVRPEFALPAIAAIPVEKAAIEVTDEEAAEAAALFVRHRAPIEALSEGELLSEDVGVFEATVRVEETELLRRPNILLEMKPLTLLSIPFGGLKDKILGQKTGETREVSAQAPADHPDEKVRGKAALLTLTLHEIKRRKAPPLDDACARELGFKDLADFRAMFKDRLRLDREKEAELKVRRQIEDWLLKNISFELPERSVKILAEAGLRSALAEGLRAGMTEEGLAGSQERLRRAAEGSAERLVRVRLILDRIASQEKILVTEDEVRAAVEAMAHGRGEDPERLLTRFEEEGTLGEIRQEIREGKVMKWLSERTQATA